MNPAIETIFLEALEIESLQKRRTFVQQRACQIASGQEADQICEAVLEMLLADEAANNDDFLGQGVFGTHDLPPPHQKSAPDDGRFEILNRYRQGGLGEVFVAFDRQLGREVAIKQIKPDWRNHDEARGRFVREAEVTGRLEHPGIVPVYAMGTWDDGSQYYAMRFIEGRTLREVIQETHFKEQDSPSGQASERSRKPLDPLQLRRSLRCFVDVCHTISYAHSRGILHRDIKPANIMVGPYGETLVVDWGLAKRLDEAAFQSDSFDENLSLKVTNDAVAKNVEDSSSTRVGGRVGTPQYMSPEQAAGRINRIGVPTDVYLLGGTLYEILCGLPPHQGDSVERIASQIQTQPPTSPLEILPNLPRPLVAICQKALAIKTENRFDSAHSLGTEIERWMADQPVSVYEENQTEQAARWIRNHRVLATSMVVAMFLLAMGSILGTLFYNAQQNERRQVALDRAAKAAELLHQQQQREAEAQQRQAELRTLAERADDFSMQEMRDSRFSSALGVVNEAISSSEGGKGFPDLTRRLSQRQMQLTRIVDFYHHAEICERKNIQSRDIHAIDACVKGLRALGVYDKTDWWNHLPVEGLSAVQVDRLQWDVYQQWMLLDAMLLKTVGVRLSGDDQKFGATSRLFGTLRRFARTDLGKPEATAALSVSDRLDGFRLSQAARWYRGGAEFRLSWGNRLQGKDLSEPANAVDAQSLGVLCLIAHLDPEFKVFFEGYRGDDPLAIAIELFAASSSLRPNHYWTQMCLAQAHYLAAIDPSRPDGEVDRHLEAASRACERCIALVPDHPFAYADRSSVSRTRAARILADESISPQRRVSKSQMLYRLSLQDAQNADRLGADEPWIGWQSGLAMREAGRIESAIERWWQTSLQTFSLVDNDDASLIRDDELRGRREVGHWLESKTNRQGNLQRQGLLAAVRLNQERWKEAGEIINGWITNDEMVWTPTLRWLVIALDLHHQRYDAVREQLKQISFDASLDPITASLLKHAEGRCFEHASDYQKARSCYREALHLASTVDHRTAQLLGLARCQAILGEWSDAEQLIHRAIDQDPALNIKQALLPVAKIYQIEKKKLAGASADPQRARADPPIQRDLKTDRVIYVAGLKQFIAGALQRSKVAIADLQFDWREGQNPPTPPAACLLDGGFELQTSRYWGGWQTGGSDTPDRSSLGASMTPNKSSDFTGTAAGFLSDAQWDTTHKRSGNSSLKITARKTGPTTAAPSKVGDQVDPKQTPALGRLVQSFPIVPGKLYRVKCWSRSEQAALGAVEVRIDQQTILRSPPGKREWSEMIGFYQKSIPTSDGEERRFVPAKLSIECHGLGTVWLDDLEILVSDSTQEGRQK